MHLGKSVPCGLSQKSGKNSILSDAVHIPAVWIRIMYANITEPEAFPMPYNRTSFSSVVIDFTISAFKRCAHMQRLVNRLHTSITASSDPRRNFDR